MDLKLTKDVKDVTIITGFPGFGLVASISTEFLIDHLKCEQIGKYWFEELPATLAIHDGKIINPIGIFYNEKYNLIIIHSITPGTGIEWKTADIILTIAQKTNAKRIIALEGVGISSIKEEKDNINTYFYSNEDEIKNKLKELQLEELKEGIIIGVTSVLMLKSEINVTGLFAETMSTLPDSKAAAKMIETLDKFIGMEVNYEPLLEQAEKFESKLKDIVTKSQTITQQKDDKMFNYVG
jgi:uncharacterized protein (TIGR00161 family)